MAKVQRPDAPVLANPMTKVDRLDLEDDFRLDDAQVDTGRVGGKSGRGGRLRFSRLRDLALAETRLDGAELTDVVLERVDLTAATMTKAALRRVSIADCRCLGIDLAEANLVGVVFTNCTLEMSNLRFTTLQRVVFDRCALRGADLGNAVLTDVAFTQCQLDHTNFAGARLSDVTLQGSSLEGLRGIADLRGATLSMEQLVGLAPQLAAELGIQIGSATDTHTR